MKDPCTRDLNRITYLDDASRCVTGAAPFKHATSENTVSVLHHQAIGRFGAPAAILSDNGSRGVGKGGHKKPSGTRTPTLFESELRGLDICLINSRPYHPQTNGKI